MKHETDTPRTDAASFSSRDPLELMKTSQQLERELANSREAYLKSVERDDYLTQALDASEHKYQHVRTLLLTRGDQLDRAVEIAEDLKKGGEMALQVIRESGRWAFEPHDDPRAEIKWGVEKLAALKEELK